MIGRTLVAEAANLICVISSCSLQTAVARLLVGDRRLENPFSAVSVVLVQKYHVLCRDTKDTDWLKVTKKTTTQKHKVMA